MQVALDELLVQVKSIERTTRLNEELVEFARVLPKHLLSPSASSLRRSVRQMGLTGMQPVLDGSILLLVAAFEQFVTDAIVSFSEELPKRIPAYSDLPKAIRSANEKQTGEILVQGRSMFTVYERQYFVENLRNCQSGATPYVLNGEAIAFNRRNLRAGRLGELFVRIGLKDVWSSLGSTGSLQHWSGRGAKVTISQAKNQLNQLILTRNQIAHRVGSTTVGPEVVRSHIRFERALARSLTKALEHYAAAL